MARPIIDEDCCKGCGRCVAACLKKCLEISGDTDGSVVTLNMRVFVGSKDARIEVK